MTELREPRIHPRQYRRSIVAGAILAMATWWGIRLPIDDSTTAENGEGGRMTLVG